MQDEHIQKLARKILEIEDVMCLLDETRARLELSRHSGLIRRPGYDELIEILGNSYLDLQKIAAAFQQLLMALDISAEMSKEQEQKNG